MPPHMIEFWLVKKILAQCICESGKDTHVPLFEMSLCTTQQCWFLSNPTCVEATVYVPMNSQYITVSDILSICLNVSNSSQTRCERASFANHYTFFHFLLFLLEITQLSCFSIMLILHYCTDLLCPSIHLNSDQWKKYFPNVPMKVEKIPMYHHLKCHCSWLNNADFCPILLV